MQHLLGRNGRRQLDQLARAHTLYAFDFDGTLARIVRNHQDAQLARPIRKGLVELGKRTCTAVISGRSVADLRVRVAGAVQHLIGNHGMEGLHAAQQVLRQARETCRAWKRQAENGFGAELSRAGATVEDKTYSLAFHYRTSGRKRTAREAVFMVLAQLSPAPRILLGKDIVNVIPGGAPHKGVALLELMHQLNCTAALYIGDDETDEDVFSLPDARIVTVRIGRKKTSAARFYLERQSEITALLQYLIKAHDKSGGSRTRLERN
jgi:trehalose 6-phosphate phosphatase